MLRFGVNERAFRITEISNSEVTDSEYAAWRAQMEKDERRMPRLREVTAATENITRAENYRYTSEDVQKMLEPRARRSRVFARTSRGRRRRCVD